MVATNNGKLEKRLWEAADELRANSKLSSSEYYEPVLGLIFLRFADQRFTQTKKQLKEEREEYTSRRRRGIGKLDYQARGVMFLPDEARFSTLVQLPESTDISAALNEAMEAIEEHNSDLRGVLPKNYNRLDNNVLWALLKNFNSIPMDVEGDAFGKIYEYFLANFAMSEGRRGGEFFTPTPLVKLIVEIIEPFHGRIYDPACGSGGMFVQSARFVEEHQANPSTEISIYGQELNERTVRLCKMNLAVHGLSGDIKQGNTYYTDIHDSRGTFDFMMANPPFNVDRVDKERLEDDPRFPFGLPRVDNANYIWMQIFYSALNGTGRAGFVMANSAADARGSEQEIRKQLIESGAVDVMVAIGSNFFYTVTLPCTLWFLDNCAIETEREDTVLFIDARHFYRQIDRAHRDFTPAQIEFLANIARLYRGEAVEMRHIPDAETNETRKGGVPAWEETFPDGEYRDIPGLCKVATRAEIESQGWSLNPGRYVGVAEREYDNDFDLALRLEELNEELELLNTEAQDLQEKIAENITQILEMKLE